MSPLSVLLIFFQLLWVVYYVIINIVGYAMSGVSQDSRQDLFSLGTHIVVVITIFHVRFRRRPEDGGGQWLPLLVFVFECARNTFSAFNITWYTTLISENQGLSIAAAVLAWYQVAVAALAALVLALVLFFFTEGAKADDYDTQKKWQRRSQQSAYNAA